MAGKFFRIPWANTGDKTAIPDDTQPDGKVSYSEGFGPDYQKDQTVDPTADDVPRPETNELYAQLTENIQQWQTLGVYDFITPAMNDGVPFPYDKWATVVLGGEIFQSIIDANITSPPDSSWFNVSQLTSAITQVFGAATVTTPANTALFTGKSIDFTGQNPKGIRFDASGNLWVVSRTNDTIEKFVFDGTDYVSSGVVVYTGSEFSQLNSLTFDAEGNMWLTDSGLPDAILKFWDLGGGFTFSGTRVDISAEITSSAIGIDFDSNGDLWVVGALEQDVFKYDPIGITYEYSGTNFSVAGETTTPRGMVIDSDDKIWIVDATGEIVRRYADPGGGYVYDNEALDVSGSQSDAHNVALDPYYQFWLTGAGPESAQQFIIQNSNIALTNSGVLLALGDAFTTPDGDPGIVSRVVDDNNVTSRLAIGAGVQNGATVRTILAGDKIERFNVSTNVWRTPPVEFLPDPATDFKLLNYRIQGMFSIGDVFDVSGQDLNPKAVFFNPDGTKMYLAGQQNNSLYQYTLSEPFVVSSASYDAVSLDVSTETTELDDFAFTPDGSKIFVLGGAADGVMLQYSLITPFDLSTASYDSVSLNVLPQDLDMGGFYLTQDGTKVFIMGNQTNNVYQYSMVTPFDMSTMSYDTISFSVGSEDNAPLNVVFSTDGYKMFFFGNTNNRIYQYSTTSSFDLSAMVYDDIYVTLPNPGIAVPSEAFGIRFNSTGTEMYIVENVGDDIHRLNTNIVVALNN